MHTIKHRLYIRTRPEKLYAAIATANGIRNWWTTDVEMDERVGGYATFSFYDRTQFNGVRIDELIPNRRVAWEMDSSSIPDLKGTYVTFDIAEAGEKVQLDFTQSGLPKGDEILAIFTSGWYLYLCSLRQYLETGDGHPHPFLDFAEPNLWFAKRSIPSAKPAVAYAVSS